MKKILMMATVMMISFGARAQMLDLLGAQAVSGAITTQTASGIGTMMKSNQVNQILDYANKVSLMAQTIHQSGMFKDPTPCKNFGFGAPAALQGAQCQVTLEDGNPVMAIGGLPLDVMQMTARAAGDMAKIADDVLILKF